MAGWNRRNVRSVSGRRSSFIGTRRSSWIKPKRLSYLAKTETNGNFGEDWLWIGKQVDSGFVEYDC